MYLSNYAKELGKDSDFIIFNGNDFVDIDIKTTDLFLAQYVGDYFNAVDVVVKYLAIENYYGINNNGFAIYKKMQMARVKEDWTEGFIKLIKSLEKGYDTNNKIETDLNYSIHDGAHRLALGLYHGLDSSPARIYNVNVLRRSYTLNWFTGNGFTSEEINIIMDKLNELLEKSRKEYFCILWPPARQQYDSIENEIKNLGPGLKITTKDTLTLSKEQLKDFIYAIYATDDISKYKLDLKYNHILSSLESDNYEGKDYTVDIIKLMLENPDFKLKHLSGQPQSKQTINIKKDIRAKYCDKVTDYYYDIIMHVTDNQKQNDEVEKIVQKIKTKKGVIL